MHPVLDQISWIVVGYSVLVALAAAYSAYRWRMKPPWLASLGWMLEFLAGLRAVLGLLVIGAVEPHALETHLGYLAASVCVMPLAIRSVKDDDGVWAIGVLGVAAVAVGVISWRMVVTL